MTDFDLPTDPHVSEGPENDGFFTDLMNTKPYAKMAFQGFAASGKTFTMVQVAIGLHKLIKSTKKVTYVDTEKAAKFARAAFGGAGIGVHLRETRSPADLIEAMKRVRAGLSDILIVDSLTHIWQAWVDAYKKEQRKDYLSMDDWGVIKGSWKTEIMDPFVNDPYHFLFTGRAGYEYDNEVNEKGKREIYKSGIKMKLEGETAYEPDILVYMERVEQLSSAGKKRGEKAVKEVYREATIIKDRANLIDGKTFRNPKIDVFMPSVEFILSNPATKPANIQAERDTGLLFRSEEDKRKFFRDRDIALEKIEAEIVKQWPGQTAEAKRMKVVALEVSFGTKSWTQIQGMKPADLNAGLEKLLAFIAHEQAVEKIDVTLNDVWPGATGEAKLQRCNALLAVYGTPLMPEVQAMPLADLTAGFDKLREYVETWRAEAKAAAEAAGETTPDIGPAAAKKPARARATAPA